MWRGFAASRRRRGSVQVESLGLAPHHQRFAPERSIAIAMHTTYLGAFRVWARERQDRRQRARARKTRRRVGVGFAYKATWRTHVHRAREHPYVARCTFERSWVDLTGLVKASEQIGQGWSVGHFWHMLDSAHARMHAEELRESKEIWLYNGEKGPCEDQIANICPSSGLRGAQAVPTVALLHCALVDLRSVRTKPPSGKWCV